MNLLISELRGYDISIDAMQIADALWLANVMGEGSVIAGKIPSAVKIEEVTFAKKDEPSLSKAKYVTHTIVLSNKKEEIRKDMSLEKSEKSASSFGVKFTTKKKLPKIEKQFRKLKIKKMYKSKQELNETKTAEYIANTGFFYPIFKEDKAKQNYYGLHIIIDKSKSMFLWQEQMEHFLESMRYSKLFNSVKIFELDSSQGEASFRYYDSQKPLDANASVFKKKQTLTLVFSDIIGLSWKSKYMFTLLELWSKGSFVSIVSMLPQEMWRRTPLRKGVKLFMKSSRRFPKNAELKAEFDFLERKLGEYSSQIPLIPFSGHSFFDLSQVLVAKKNAWVDTRVFKSELYDKTKVEKKKEILTASQRVENFLASSLPDSRLLAIYCSVLPLNKEIIQKVVEVKELGKEMDAFSEFYFGGLLFKDSQSKLGEYSFYQGVRQELLEYISMEEAKILFKIMDSVISNSLGIHISMLELLHEHNNKIDELSPIEVELVRLLIEILGEKGKFYQKDIDRLQPLTSTIYLTNNTYQMGSEDGHDDEKPVHTITFDRDFAIAKSPVTFAEYDLYCEDNKDVEKPSDEGWGRGKRPVINVSWEDANEYCKWLSKKTNKEYRLPTEAEWEYACRAGTITKWSFGDDENELAEYAWYNKNANSKTHEVATKKENPWGLHDMHGNIWEWCQDDWVDNYDNTPRDGTAYEDKNSSSKVLRGGSWGGFAGDTRSEFRYDGTPDFRSNIRGFRLLRTLP